MELPKRPKEIDPYYNTKELVCGKKSFMITEKSYREYHDTFSLIKKDIQDAKIQLGYLIEMETMGTDVSEEDFSFCLQILRQERNLKENKKKKSEKNRIFNKYRTGIEDTIQFLKYESKFYFTISWISFVCSMMVVLIGAACFTAEMYAESSFLFFVLKIISLLYFLFAIFGNLAYNKEKTKNKIDEKFQLSGAYLLFMSIGLLLYIIFFIFN